MSVFGVVYLIWNMISGKKYVGQTRQPLGKRIASHKHNKKSLIGKAFHKYGAENFRYGVIKTCESKAEIDYWEKFFIATLKTKSPTGYNRTDGGDGSAGCIDSEETRARKSEARLGEKNPNYGKKRSPETVAKTAVAKRFETPYKNLLSMITEKKLLYSDLDKLLGLGQSSFSHKMRGKVNFTEQEIAKLTEIFGKPAEYLLQRDDGVKAATSEAKKYARLSAARHNNSPFKNLICEMDMYKFTCASLAQILELDASQISRKIRGEIIFTEKDIAKLVEIFGRPAEYLMKRDDME